VETKKRRLIIGLLLVTVMLVLFYFAGLFNKMPAKQQRCKALVASLNQRQVPSSFIILRLTIRPAEGIMSPSVTHA
jgi:hypothetical protein